MAEGLNVKEEEAVGEEQDQLGRGHHFLFFLFRGVSRCRACDEHEHAPDDDATCARVRV